MVGYIAVELTGCGSSTEGLQLNRLMAADIITSWTECVPVRGTGQRRHIGSAVHQVRIQLLLPTPGRNSEHSSELTHHGVCDYCQRHIAQLARSRAHKENTQANVEHLSRRR
jgi:hypothetical protein